LKKIGIIGGLAWPSTADYYRLLCRRANEHFGKLGQEPPHATVPMLIESLNINETRSLRGVEGDEASWSSYDTKFRESFLRLKNAGADFGMIASNTPHMRLHGITKGLDFPVVSILDTTASAVASRGGEQALMLGTTVTMKSSVYSEVLLNHGVTALPRIEDDEMSELARIIDIDLYQGKIDGARDTIVELSKKYIKSPAKDYVCLACTELPLAFPEQVDAEVFEYAGIRFINTIAAHVSAVLDRALESGDG